jgi:hypothetical protein
MRVERGRVKKRGKKSEGEDWCLENEIISSGVAKAVV